MHPKYSALLEGQDSVPLHIYTSFQYSHHIRCSNNSKKKSTYPTGVKKKEVASPLPWPHEHNDHHHLAIASRAEAANGASAE